MTCLNVAAEMADVEPMALSQDLGDAAAVAYPPMGLVAQQAARHCFGYLCSLLEVDLGLGADELFLDDAPKPRPFATPVGKTPFRRCPQCCQMNIPHPGILDRRSELP